MNITFERATVADAEALVTVQIAAFHHDAVRNQHFYEKLGYVKVKEETFPGITLIGYEKRIG